MSTTLRLLYIGDVVGKAGRAAVTALVPGLREQLQLDVVLMNAENMAHGNGISTVTVTEMVTSGVDYFSSGNHVWDNKDGVQYLHRSDAKVIRPANLPPTNPGKGWIEFEIGSKRVLLINVLGQVFMPQQADNPFHCLDAILQTHPAKNYHAIIVDIHAEATSEKQALAQYLDGRVSLVVGTHTHVPTADLRILSHGTGLVCDLGFVGVADAVLGANKTKVLHRFLTQMPGALSPAETGQVLFNSVLFEIDPVTRQTVRMERVDRAIEL
ncbi:MAG: YmdB family metallophosphoesterase [Candidatus Kerfeldbacteria bacterium]|nr:YmdB family metallophosphoesterase [Candidatus Kerfeldbacteria bacterium]